MIRSVATSILALASFDKQNRVYFRLGSLSSLCCPDHNVYRRGRSVACVRARREEASWRKPYINYRYKSRLPPPRDRAPPHTAPRTPPDAEPTPAVSASRDAAPRGGPHTQLSELEQAGYRPRS